MNDNLNKMIEDKVRDINYNQKVFNFLETKEGISLFFKIYRILAPINIALLTSVFGLSLVDFLYSWVVVSLAVIGVGELLAFYSVYLASFGLNKEERKRYFENNFLKRFTLGTKKTRANEMKECKELIDKLKNELLELRNKNKLEEKQVNYENDDTKKKIPPINRSFEINTDIKIKRR